MNRRDFIIWNALACAGAATPALWKFLDSRGLVPRAPLMPKARSVVILQMNGGPSQVELFDHKPDLYKYDGMLLGTRHEGVHDFQNGKIIKPITSFAQHGNSGQWVSDLLPNLAKVIDELTLIKSFNARSMNHSPAILEFLTGVALPGHPFAGSWINYALNRTSKGLPNTVVLTDPKGPTRVGNLAWSSPGLPKRESDSTFVFSDIPKTRQMLREVVTDAQGGGARFLRDFADLTHLDTRSPAEISEQRLNEFRLIYSMRESLLAVIRTEDFTAHERMLYGVDDPVCKTFAEQLIVARRLVEAEVPYVHVICGDDFEASNWDHHNHIEDILGMARKVDRPLYGFLTDLKERGLLNETVVFWGGEFGKGPMIDLERKNGTGRPHNMAAGTVWLAGAGLKKGFTLGETDELSYKTVRDRVEMGDIWATIFHLLGVDHKKVSFANDRMTEMRLTRLYHRVLHEILV